MNEFDLKAAEWDKNPMHWDRSVAIADCIINQIPLKSCSRALEYGAGTGILSFLLKDHLKEIILMDNSSEMIRMIDEKIVTTKVKNLKSFNFDLENKDLPGEKFDLIFTQMVLHHIIDIENIIRKFHKLLNSEGFLGIADLYPEDGSFHGEGFNGHNGFDPEYLGNILLRHGFRNIFHSQCFTIQKVAANQELRKFEVFLLTCQLQA